MEDILDAFKICSSFYINLVDLLQLFNTNCTLKVKRLEIVSHVCKQILVINYSIITLKPLIKSIATCSASQQISSTNATAITTPPTNATSNVDELLVI